MNYIKITNTTASVPRLYLEILGVSTKRGSDITIGQFGSGTKFAPIFALREGWEWINTGFDRDGGYTMSYEISDDNSEGLELVEFVYEDVHGNITKKLSSYSLGAGELGWNHPFQIFREAFANALDAYYEFDAAYSIETVAEVGPPVEGEFSVYLTASDGLLDVVNNFDKYFSLERTPIFKNDQGNKIYNKLDDTDGVRIYHKGVLVYGGELDHDDTPSLFDYDLTDIKINEERRLSDVSSHEIYSIARVLGENRHYLDDDSGIQALVDIIVSDGLETESGKPDGIWEYGFAYAFQLNSWDDIDPYEDTSFGRCFVDAMIIKRCDNTHNNVAFVCDRSSMFGEIELKLNERGRKAIPVSSAMYELLSTAGAEEWMDKTVLGEEYDTTFIELDGVDLDMFNFAYESVAGYDTSILNIPVKIMQSTPHNDMISGKAININSSNKPAMMAINHNLIKKGNMKQIIATLLHEMDHVITGASDNTRAFRNAADDRLGDLVVKHYCDKASLAKIINSVEV